MEVLVSVLIFSFMAAGLYGAYNSSKQAWQNNDNNVLLQREARKALLVMVPELRQASGITITQNSTSATISFTHSSLGSVTYSWSTSGANANKIIKQTSTVTRTLADNISALSFSNPSGAVIINLTATKTQTTGQVASFSLTEKVAIR